MERSNPYSGGQIVTLKNGRKRSLLTQLGSPIVLGPGTTQAPFNRKPIRHKQHGDIAFHPWMGLKIGKKSPIPKP